MRGLTTHFGKCTGLPSGGTLVHPLYHPLCHLSKAPAPSAHNKLLTIQASTHQGAAGTRHRTQPIQHVEAPAAPLPAIAAAAAAATSPPHIITAATTSSK